MAVRRGIPHGLLVAAATFLLVLGVAYAGFCAFFYKYEPAFVFARVPSPSGSPQAAGMTGFSEITIAAEGGARLYGWWGPPQPGHGAVLFFTGSGVRVSDYAPLFRDLAEHGLGVASVDYRGSGASTGDPSEVGWRADARALYDFVHQAAPQARIAAFGESMGTGFAIGLALERPVAGVLLNSPYVSVQRQFEMNGWPLPYWLLMTDRLDSGALIGKLRVPLMILHGLADSNIPVAEARRLFAMANPPKEMIEVPGAQHTMVWVGEARRRALAALTAWTGPEAAR